MPPMLLQVLATGLDPLCDGKPAGLLSLLPSLSRTGGGGESLHVVVPTEMYYFKMLNPSQWSNNKHLYFLMPVFQTYFRYVDGVSVHIITKTHCNDRQFDVYIYLSFSTVQYGLNTFIVFCLLRAHQAGFVVCCEVYIKWFNTNEGTIYIKHWTT